MYFALDVEREQLRQFHKWGRQDHSSERWLCILGEEVGEAFQASNDGNYALLYQELVQVAAVAKSMAESLRRQGII